MNEKRLKDGDKLERKLAAANEMRRMIPAGMQSAGGDPIATLGQHSEVVDPNLSRRTFFHPPGRWQFAGVTRYRNESRDLGDPHVTSEREFRVRHILCFCLN